MTLMMITLMTRTQCLAESIVIPGVKFLYRSSLLRRLGRIVMVQRLNICFKASARSSGRRLRMCVWDV